MVRGVAVRWLVRDPAAERRIRSRALAIGVSVVPFGLSFGAVSVEAHLTIVQTCLLSLVLFSGASQFALVSVIGSGGSIASAVGTALVLGVRNGLYATRINALLRPRGWRKPLTAQFTIDETTAMAIAEPETGLSARAFWSTAAAVYVLWNVSTVVGAVAGTALGSPAAAGLDAAGPAAFTALLAPRLTTRSMRLVALAAAVIAIGTVPFVPVGAPILIGGLAALSLLLRRRDR